MTNNLTENGSTKGLWRSVTRLSQFALDLLVISGAFILAYLLRFDFALPANKTNTLLLQLLYVVALQFVALKISGVYSFIWRYVGMDEIRYFLRAALASVVPILLLRLSLPAFLKGGRVPLSVIVMDTLLAFGGVLGLRVLRRALYEGFEKRHRARRVNGNGQAKAVLLIGAGRAGVLTAREIQNRGDMDLLVKGFVDDDPQKQDSVINGVTVLGTTADLPRLVRELEIDHVVVTIAEASRRDFRRIMETCQRIPIKVRTIPGLFEILQGDVKVTRIRDIEIEDLLGREPVNLDEASMSRFLVGKRVMVTGAGGSIGSELSRQIARFGPASLLLVERAECALFYVDQELREQWPGLSIETLVGDIGDELRMEKVFQQYRPQVVLHAAAHKHVPMMESNVSEAVKNNVLATRLLGEIAGRFRTEIFVLISTDKAVRPTSVMGATKRVAELVLQNLNGCYRTRYVAVRFGNVIGSAGSVIPIFRKQISRGGPVTVTHPEMVRYFMTIPEASQLVLQAGAIGAGGEIFILDMGEPVRILDLAKETITLSGFKPFIDIDIRFTGIRPGEKLFEELDTKDERVVRTLHPKILIGQIAAPPEDDVREAVNSMAALAYRGEEQKLRGLMNQLLADACLEIEDEEVEVTADLFAVQPVLAATAS